MTSLVKQQPVPESDRFNWKDGFYNPEKMEAYKAAAERDEMERAYARSQNRQPNGKGRPARDNRGRSGKNNYGRKGVNRGGRR